MRRHARPHGRDGADVTEPLEQRVVTEFPYKHSTGEVIGRFLAGLKDQKRIWGQRVAGQGVVVPPVGYSETDGSAGGQAGGGKAPRGGPARPAGVPAIPPHLPCFPPHSV